MLAGFFGGEINTRVDMLIKATRVYQDIGRIKESILKALKDWKSANFFKTSHGGFNDISSE